MRSKVSKIIGTFKRYCQEKDGATALEYAFIVAVLVVALIPAMSLISGTQSSVWSDLSNTFAGS